MATCSGKLGSVRSVPVELVAVPLMQAKTGCAFATLLSGLERTGRMTDALLRKVRNSCSMLTPSVL